MAGRNSSSCSGLFGIGFAEKIIDRLKGETRMSVRMTIRRSGRNEIDFLIQDTQNNSGESTILRHFPQAKEFHWLPASPFVYDSLKGDNIVAGMVGNPLIDALLKKATPPKAKKKLKEGAYLIKQVRSKKRTSLVLIGGDLSGFHFGLSDLARNLSLNSPGLEYLGGEKYEEPAFPLRYFWNWDLRTRWNTDTDKIVTWCCLLDYPESTEFFLDNMKRVIDGAVDYRINGITVFGFIRDEHGGIEATQEICRYAAERGINMIPGVGTHHYGGFYYRGNHPFNLDTMLKQNPDSRKMYQGKKYPVLCPTDPKGIAWLKEGIHWLFETFEISGVFLENGDYNVCSCPRCERAVRKLKSKNPAFYQYQYLCYLPVLEELDKIKKSKWNIYSTYAGWSPLYGLPAEPLEPQYVPGDPRDNPLFDRREKILQEPPIFAKSFPANSIAEWNINGQLRNRIPLEAFLDDGTPKIVWENPRWPRDLKSPIARNVLLHGARGTRVAISMIKELCLRTADGDYQGLGGYGEGSPKYVQTELNYLAVCHFAYHPKDSLREFAKAQLSSRVGGEELAEKFIEYLCKNEKGILTEKEKRKIGEIRDGFSDEMQKEPWELKPGLFDNMRPYRYWLWLSEIDLKNDKHTVFEM